MRALALGDAPREGYVVLAVAVLVASLLLEFSVTSRQRRRRRLSADAGHQVAIENNDRALATPWIWTAAGAAAVLIPEASAPH